MVVCSETWEFQLVDGFFAGMKDNEILDISNKLSIECPWFCFHQILQNDLNMFRKHYNSHRIIKSKYCSVSGFPNVLFYLPYLSRKTVYKFSLPHEDKLAIVKCAHSLRKRHSKSLMCSCFLL